MKPARVRTVLVPALIAVVVLGLLNWALHVAKERHRGRAANESALPRLEGPHKHAVPIRQGYVHFREDISVSTAAELPEAESVERQRSPDGRFEAVVTSGEGVPIRLFVREVRAGALYEVRVPLGYRPFSDLAWDGRFLVFDRWSQPHYGVHYELDLLNRRIVTAAPFPDAFYLEQQRPKE